MHGGRELMFREGVVVDKDRAQGTTNQVVGRVTQRLGEWRGDKDAEIEGFAQEVKGKAQKAWGGAKNALRAARNEVRQEQATSETQPPRSETYRS